MTRPADLYLEIVLALSLAVVLARGGAWRRVVLGRLATARDLRLYWVPLFPVLPVLPAALSALAGRTVPDLALLLALAALVGFVEEVAFRGLLLQWLLPRGGAWKAAVLSSVAFGVMHFVNLLTGSEMSATLLQALYATGVGFAFAAVTLRTGALWPLIVIHFLMDLAGFLTVAPAAPTGMTAAHVGLTGLYAVSFVAYGALVLRTTPGTRAMARPRRRRKETRLVVALEQGWPP